MIQSRLLSVTLLVLFAVACHGLRSPETEGGDGDSATRLHVPPHAIGLNAPEIPESPAEIRSGRVAFLPMLNRGDRHVHPVLLDGPAAALAAWARAHLDREVVRPDLVEEILFQAGRPNWFVVPNEFDYDAELLDEIARRTGAGLLVWTELSPDDAVSLRSHEAIEGAGSHDWSRIELELDPATTIDRHLYDAPRRILEEVAPRFEGRGKPASPRSTESGREDWDDELAKARESMWTGMPGAFRMAEHRLAALAERHPNRAAAWVDLAFVRVLRSMVEGDNTFQDLVNDGASPARHLARLLPDLTTAERARLDFVDHAYVGEADDQATYEALIESMPVGSIERTLIAWLHHDEDPDRFGIARDAAPGALGWLLPELAEMRSKDARRDWAIGLLEDEEMRGLVSVSPLVFHHIRRRFDEDGKWMSSLRIRALDQPHAVADALATWRGICLGLPAARQASCVARVADWVGKYLPESVPGVEGVADEAFWDGLQSEVFGVFFQPPALESGAPRTEDEPILERNPTFAGQLHLITGLLDLSNELLAMRDESGPVVGNAASLLIARDRTRLARDLDWLLDSAYQPALIGSRRAQRDEYEDYARLLEPYSHAFGVAFDRRRLFDGKLKRDVHPLSTVLRLSRHRPYDYSWYSLAKNKIREWGHEHAATARERIVPYRGWLYAEGQNQRRWLGDHDGVIERLEERISRRPNYHASRVLEYAMKDAGRSVEDRLAVLAAGEAMFPLDANLTAAVADVALEAERYDEARERYASLFPRHGYVERACNGLAAIGQREGNFAAVEAQLVECVDRLPSKWDVARTWDRIANLRRDDDRLEESMAAMHAARGLIGGASYVLTGIARTHELLGNYAEAEASLRANDRIYADSWVGRHGLAYMELGRGRPEIARGVLKEILAEEEKAPTDYNVNLLSRRIHVALDDLDGLRELAETNGHHGWVVVAEAEWIVNRDRDAVEAALAKASSLLDEPCQHLHSVRARMLLDLGESKAAEAEAEAAWAIARNGDTERTLVEARLAVGEHDWLVDYAETSKPWVLSAWLTKARAAEAQGDLAGARAAIQWGVKRTYNAGLDGQSAWPEWIEPLLLYERSLVGRAGDRNDDERLARDLAWVAKRRPFSSDVWEALAGLEKRLGREAASREAQSRALALVPRSAGRAMPAKQAYLP